MLGKPGQVGGREAAYGVRRGGQDTAGPFDGIYPDTGVRPDNGVAIQGLKPIGVFIPPGTGAKHGAVRLGQRYFSRCDHARICCRAPSTQDQEKCPSVAHDRVLSPGAKMSH